MAIGFICEDIASPYIPELIKGVEQLMRHLFDLGHKLIAMIAGPEESGRDDSQIARYISAMKSTGLGGHIRYEHTDFSMEQGLRTARRMLEVKGGERPAAIIGNADLSVIGALKAAKELGLGVPDDVSSAGWGGIDYGLYTDPPITSLMVPRYRLGIEAAKLLLKCAADKNASCEPVHGDLLPVTLAVRGSTGQCPDRPD